MDLTLSIDDEVAREASRRAEAIGKSLDQLVRDYLEQYAGKVDRKALAEEYLRLTRESRGDSQGWKFNRDEIHERR